MTFRADHSSKDTVRTQTDNVLRSLAEDMKLTTVLALLHWTGKNKKSYTQKGAI